MNSSPIDSGNLSKVPARNVCHMLLYAWDLAKFQDLPELSSEDSPSLLGLLATLLINSVDKLLRRQLFRVHSEKSDWIKGVKGRINFSTSVKSPRFELGEIYCTHPVLSIDSLENQIIKSTLHKLALDCRIFHPSKRKESEIKERIRGAYHSMEGIRTIPLSDSTFSKVQLAAGHEIYKLPLQICALVRRLKMPKENQGDTTLRALLSDQITFGTVFEAFVRNYCSYHLDAKVKKEYLNWKFREDCRYMPMLETDVTIEYGNPVFKRLVVEAKYYFDTLVRRGTNNTSKFHSAHLYQLYAYLRTQEDDDEVKREAEGLLLYPTVSLTLDEKVTIQGHKIRIATLDLCQDWRTVEAQLYELVK